MGALEDIHEYSTAEFLAREDDFTQSSLELYLDQARKAIYGTDSGFDEAVVERVRLHRLLLENNEAEFLQARPDLQPEFASSDDYQLTMAASQKNLDYFLDNGIGFEFDADKLSHARSIAANAGKTAMKALMREKLLTLSGFDGVSMNFIFHDVLDHAWLFKFMRDQDLHDKYSDLIVAAGNPFKGHLMSRESELLSGIGFTSRRYLSDADYYGSFAMEPGNLVSLLQSQVLQEDSRVKEAVELVENDKEAAAWAGFVVKATISNLILQRERWGAVKELKLDENGNYEKTGKILSLTDSRYVALIVETTRLLREHKQEYMAQEPALTTSVESVLQRFLDGGEAAGSIAIIQTVDLDDLDAMKKYGLSTNHFSKKKNK
jgi:hypothetical protein